MTDPDKDDDLSQEDLALRREELALERERFEFEKTKWEQEREDETRKQNFEINTGWMNRIVASTEASWARQNSLFEASLSLYTVGMHDRPSLHAPRTVQEMLEEFRTVYDTVRGFFAVPAAEMPFDEHPEVPPASPPTTS